MSGLWSLWGICSEPRGVRCKKEKENLKGYKMDSRGLRFILPWFIYYIYRELSGSIEVIFKGNGTNFQDSLFLQLITLNSLFVFGACISIFFHKEVRKGSFVALASFFFGLIIVFLIVLLVNFFDSGIEILQGLACYAMLSLVVLGFLINTLFQKFVLKNGFVKYKDI